MIPPETMLVQPTTFRLIPSAIFKGPILRPLVDTEQELEILAALERMTSKRSLQRKINPDVQDWGSSCIEAAFAYRRPGGNRFNDATHGAWYGGFEQETALREVIFHKTRELQNINYFHDEVHYHALHASFIGRFHDVQGISPSPDFLDPDVAIGYPAGQALAKELLRIGSRGLVYPSVRNPGGTCIVAFQEIVVQDVQPGAKWKLTWSGSAECTAEAV